MKNYSQTFSQIQSYIFSLEVSSTLVFKFMLLNLKWADDGFFENFMNKSFKCQIKLI